MLKKIIAVELNQTIREYLESATPTPIGVQEISGILSRQNPGELSTMITTLNNQIYNDSKPRHHHIDALMVALIRAPKEALDGMLLCAVFNTMLGKVSTNQIITLQTENAISPMLDVLEITVMRMIDLGIAKVNHEYQEAQIGRLEEGIRKVKFYPFQYKMLLLVHHFKYIGNDLEKWEVVMGHTLHGVAGVGEIINGVGNKDVSKIVKGVARFVSAVREGINELRGPSGWYKAFIEWRQGLSGQLSVRSGWDKIYEETTNEIKNVKAKEMTYGVLETLNRWVYGHQFKEQSLEMREQSNPVFGGFV